MNQESGFSLIELLIASLILTTTFVVVINVFGGNMLQSSQGRNQLKATEIARGKLDTFKVYARKASINGAFNALTQSSIAMAYNLSNTVTINDLAIIWRVQQIYSFQNGTIVADATSPTVTTKLLRLLATIQWNEGANPSKITMTAYVSDVTP